MKRIPLIGHIYNDHGVEFQYNGIEESCDKLGITHEFFSPITPQLMVSYSVKLEPIKSWLELCFMR